MAAWESPDVAMQPLSACFHQNSAGFIWRLYGSVTGMMPTSQSTENTLLWSPTHKHAHAPPTVGHFESPSAWLKAFCIQLWVTACVWLASASVQSLCVEETVTGCKNWKLVLLTGPTLTLKTSEWVYKKREHIWIVAAVMMVDFLFTLHVAPFLTLL